MPKWTVDGSEESYWSAADEFERVNGRLFKEVVFAAPVELTEQSEKQLQLIREFVKSIVQAECLPYTYAIHAGKGHNPHVHLMISERVNDGLERSPDTWFKRMATGNTPLEKGGARKSEALKPKAWLENTRKRWAQLANAHLLVAGYESRIDHRTLEEQGIARRPTQHIGPGVVALERKGIRTERGDTALVVEELNELMASIQSIDEEIEEMETAIEEIRRQREAATESDQVQKEKAVSQKHEEEREQQRRIHLAISGTQETYEETVAEGKRWRESYQARLWRQHYGERLPENVKIAYIDLKGKEGVQIRLDQNSRIVDAGDSIFCKSGCDAEIDAMLHVAKAKKWTKIRFQGDYEFRKTAAIKAIKSGDLEIDWKGSQLNPEEFRYLLPAEQNNQVDPVDESPSGISPVPNEKDKTRASTQGQEAANDDEWDEFAAELRTGAGSDPEEHRKRLEEEARKARERAEQEAELKDKALDQVLDESGVTERHTSRAYRPGRR
ncbi:MAG: MobA/MobL family protein [Candidatus Thiodiazotropha sp.]